MPNNQSICSFIFSAPTLWEPNKFCDCLADLCLDFFLQREPDAFTQTHVFLKHGQLQVSVHTQCTHAVQEQAKQILPYRIFEYFLPFYEAQYLNHDYGSLGLDLKIFPATAEQMYTKQTDLFAFGFASYETEDYLPLGTVLAHKIAAAYQQKIAKSDLHQLPAWSHIYLVLKYEHLIPRSISSIQLKLPQRHGEDQAILLATQKEQLCNLVLAELPLYLQPSSSNFHVAYIPQPSVQMLWAQSGTHVISDHYGINIPSTLALSGLSPQNPSKAAHYMARLISRAIVQSGIATQCTTLLSYHPVHQTPSLQLNFHDTQLGGFSAAALEVILKQNLDLSTEGIIKFLHLNAPIYQQTSALGPFGNGTLSWEGAALKDLCTLLDSIENAFLNPTTDFLMHSAHPVVK